MTENQSAATPAGIIRIHRTHPDAGVQHERIDLCDLTGQPVLTLGFQQIYPLAARLLEVADEITWSYPETVDGVLRIPAVSAADMAGAFDMGRRFGLLRS